MLFSKPKERVIATIGYPGHGKSVFLASLFWDSFFALSRSLRDGKVPYSVRAMNEAASKLFYGNAKLLRDKRLPPGNPRGRPEPAVLEFNGVPRPKSRSRHTITLTFFDIAGEAFIDDARTREYAPFVVEATDFVFLFDPTQSDFSALAAADLVDRICRITKNSEKKNAIIALTKMDELRVKGDFWADVIGNYWPDVPPTSQDLPDYLHQMDAISETLREAWWLNETQQAYNLINSMPIATCHFCVISALGHEPVWECNSCGSVSGASLKQCNRCQRARENSRLLLTKEPEPFRVRDPLFFVFRAAGVM